MGVGAEVTMVFYIVSVPIFLFSEGISLLYF